MLVEAVGGPRAAGRVRERSGNIVGLDVHGQGGGAPGILESFLTVVGREERQFPLSHSSTTRQPEVGVLTRMYKLPTWDKWDQCGCGITKTRSGGGPGTSGIRGEIGLNTLVLIHEPLAGVNAHIHERPLELRLRDLEGP